MHVCENEKLVVKHGLCNTSSIKKLGDFLVFEVACYSHELAKKIKLELFHHWHGRIRIMHLKGGHPTL